VVVAFNLELDIFSAIIANYETEFGCSPLAYRWCSPFKAGGQHAAMKPTDNTCNIMLQSFWLATLISTPSLFTASCGLVWFEESIGLSRS
jgi:hypothetical protein